MSFYERLSELMVENSLTSISLAKVLHVNSATIRAWKNNLKGISLSNALKLCNYFNCSLNYLFNSNDNKLDFTPKAMPSFYQSLLNCLSHRNTTRYRLVKETSLSDGNLHSYKLGGDPFMESLIIFANYLNITLD